jgi:hypothetical protein
MRSVADDLEALARAETGAMTASARMLRALELGALELDFYAHVHHLTPELAAERLRARRAANRRRAGPPGDLHCSGPSR